MSGQAAVLAYSSAKVAGDRQGGDLVVDLTGDHCELVASDPGDGVCVSRHRLNSPSGLGEDEITQLVTEPVVDMLEIVEVDDDHSQFPPGVPRVHQGFVEALVEQTSVGKTGQLVMETTLPKGFLPDLELGDVDQSHGECGVVAAAVADGLQAGCCDQHPAGGTVGMGEGALADHDGALSDSPRDV